MEFHQLRDFVAVASTGSFSEAASKCRVAQPSLSKAVQKLEAEVGESLFVRTKRRATLTPAGEVLYRRAQRIIEEMEQARRELAETNGLRRGKVRVGALPTISPYFLPRVLVQFSRDFPSLRVIVVEERREDLLKRIQDSDLDLALLAPPIPGNGFAREILFKEELLLTVPSEHPLAVKKRIQKEDLHAERFILVRECYCNADGILKFCQENNLDLQLVVETSQIETVHSLVMAGMGISLVPEMATTGRRIPLVYRSLEKLKPTRSVSVIWRAGQNHSRAAGEFLNHLRQTAKTFVETLKNESS